MATPDKIVDQSYTPRYVALLKFEHHSQTFGGAQAQLGKSARVNIMWHHICHHDDPDNIT
jgi:hypothetical protein